MSTKTTDTAEALGTIRDAFAQVLVKPSPATNGEAVRKFDASLVTLEQALAEQRARAERAEQERDKACRANMSAIAKWEQERDAADKRSLEMCAVQEAEMQARLRAEADNAALLRDLKTVCRALGIYNAFIADAPQQVQQHFNGVTAITRDAWDVYSRVLNADPHPGAALLERLAKAEQMAVAYHREVAKRTDWQDRAVMAEADAMAARAASVAAQDKAEALVDALPVGAIRGLLRNTPAGARDARGGLTLRWETMERLAGVLAGDDSPTVQGAHKLRTNSAPLADLSDTGEPQGWRERVREALKDIVVPAPEMPDDHSDLDMMYSYGFDCGWRAAGRTVAGRLGIPLGTEGEGGR